MKKLIVEKEEGIAEVIDRLIAEPDDDVVIVVPKGSTLGRSVKNFHLLKREADGAGKNVSVESVDDTILAFAKESGIEGAHPLWRGVRGAGGGVSDIVSAEAEVDEAEEEEEEQPRKKKTASRKSKKTDSGVKLTVRTEHEEEEVQIEPTIGDVDEGAEEKLTTELEETEEKEERFFAAGYDGARTAAAVAAARGEEDEDGEGERYEEEDEDENLYERRSSKKLIWGSVIALIAIVGGFFFVTLALGHASVAITFKKTPWNYQGSFVADKAASTASASTDVIPAQVFSTVKNTTLTFPASGHSNVSAKAQGQLTIYNAYNSSPQELVATTRFQTPDGKIFRIVKSVNVPGAQVSGGQLTPSSIVVTAVADQAGPSYNIGPVTKLTIPGFQGGPRFNGFYGALLNGASGGGSGPRAMPTAADITAAKAKVTQALQNNLTSSFTTAYPQNFKILPNATNVAITKLTVASTTDDQGNFSVYGEATLQAIGFDEAAFKTFLLSMAQTTEPSSTWSSLNLNYSSVQADFNRGRVAFTVTAQGALEPAFSPDDFKTEIAGKSIGEARLDIAALPQLGNGTISVWPMWLWGIPSNPSKIQLSAD